MFYNKMLNDFIFYFFALFIFASTFSIAMAQASLGCSLVLFIVLIIKNKINPFGGVLKYFYISIGLYISWMLISGLMGATPLRSVAIVREEWLFLAIPIGIYLFKKEQYQKYLLHAFAVGVGLVSIYAVMQAVWGLSWFKEKPLYEAANFGYMVKGFFSHRLTFGNYFAVGSMFFTGVLIFSWSSLAKRMKMILTVISLLAICATLLTYSYGAILGMVVGGCCVIVLSKNKKLIGLSIIPLALVIAILAGTSLGERVSSKFDKELDSQNQMSRVFIWEKSFEMVWDNPVFGVGQGNFYDVFEAKNPGGKVHVHAHNDIINIAAIAGIPGMVFFVLIWVSFFGTNRYLFKKMELNIGEKSLLTAAMVGGAVFMVTSLTEATFADEEVRQMLMFIWAAGLYKSLEFNKLNREPN